LRERPSESKDLENLWKTEDIISTEDLLENYTRMKNISLTKRIHKTRLFDMLIGDWDRHYVNGAGPNTKNNKLFINLFPRDRDQAFLNMMALAFNPNEYSSTSSYANIQG
jgi:hypothetical protein